MLGPSVLFSDPRVTDALADSVDFILIELEHSAMSPEALTGHTARARERSA